MKFKTGDTVWIDARHLGRYLAEDLGLVYVSLHEYDFQVAYSYPKDRIYAEQGNEFVINIVPTCCSDI